MAYEQPGAGRGSQKWMDRREKRGRPTFSGQQPPPRKGGGRTSAIEFSGAGGFSGGPARKPMPLSDPFAGGAIGGFDMGPAKSGVDPSQMPWESPGGGKAPGGGVGGKGNGRFLR